MVDLMYLLSSWMRLTMVKINKDTVHEGGVQHGSIHECADGAICIVREGNFNILYILEYQN